VLLCVAFTVLDDADIELGVQAGLILNLRLSFQEGEWKIRHFYWAYRG
jgi:hypothetical protein